MSGIDTSVIHVHSLSLWLLSYDIGARSRRQTGNCSKVERVTFPTTTSIVMLSPSSLFVRLKQRLTKLNSQTTSASVDQRYILTSWLLTANPSLSHEYIGKINWKKLKAIAVLIQVYVIMWLSEKEKNFFHLGVSSV